MASPVINILSKFKSAYRKAAPYLIESGEVALKRNGVISSEISNLLRSFDDFKAAGGSSKLMSFSEYGPSISKSPDLERQVIGQLKHGVAAKDPSAFIAAARARTDMNLAYGEAASVGVPVAPRLSGNYWPKMYDPDLFRGVSMRSMVDHLVNTGQASSRLRAEDIINRMRPGGKKFPNLEMRRTLKLPGEREDIGVVLDYLEESNRRIAETKFFGANDEKLEFLLSSAIDAGEDHKFARLVTELFLGRPVGKAGRLTGGATLGKGGPIYQGIASFEAATKLGLAVIGNATQPLNNVIRAGLRPTVSALVDTISNYGNAREFGLRSGSAYHQALQEVRRQVGLEAGNIGEKVLRYSGFSAVEKFNRIFSANVGKHMAHEQFEVLMRNQGDSLAKATLHSLGVDVEKAIIGKSLSSTDLLRAGKRVSDQTQFRSTVLDVPVSWRMHPVMRILTMYKHFAFNQAKFIKNFVIKPAIYQREFRPLLYMSILFPAFGEVAADIKTLLRKGSLKDRPNGKYFLDRAIDNFAQVGSLGIFEDLSHVLFSGREDRIYSFIAGPALSDAARFVANLGAADKERAFGRQATRAIPIAGPLISRKLYPPRSRVIGPLRRGRVTKGAKNILRDLGLLEPRPDMFNK